MTVKQYQDELLTLLEEADLKFQGELPFIENQIYKRIQLLIKDLDIRNGVILNSTANLKIIGKIKTEIENAVLTPKYLKAVQEFVNVYDQIALLQQKYFKTNFDQKITPAAKLDELKKQAKFAIAQKLTGAGLEANVIEQIQDLLRKNITRGGSFTDMSFQIQELVVSGDGHPGKLAAYAKSIVTDGINEFSAQYHEIISVDLGLFWRMYVGSNIATTREWCKHMTKKKYVHSKEIPVVLSGMIDGHQVRINPITELWYGAKLGTNENNLYLNRGGHNCGHQFNAVSEVVVPTEIRIATYTRLGIEHKNGKMVKSGL